MAGLVPPHPLRCRALDHCFSVALDRLPTSTELQHHHDDDFHKAAPLLSNALAAALKRAYAHHRRIKSGGIEVDDHRVGVPHLVLAILDDPSMACVMREESFSSTAVKAAMLRSLSDLGTPDSGAAGFLLGGEGGESGGGAQEGQLVHPVLAGDTPTWTPSCNGAQVHSRRA
jgi:hypothetical protein